MQLTQKTNSGYGQRRDWKISLRASSYARQKDFFEMVSGETEGIVLNRLFDGILECLFILLMLLLAVMVTLAYGI